MYINYPQFYVTTPNAIINVSKPFFYVNPHPVSMKTQALFLRKPTLVVFERNIGEVTTSHGPHPWRHHIHCILIIFLKFTFSLWLHKMNGFLWYLSHNFRSFIQKEVKNIFRMQAQNVWFLGYSSLNHANRFHHLLLFLFFIFCCSFYDLLKFTNYKIP